MKNLFAALLAGFLFMMLTTSHAQTAAEAGPLRVGSQDWFTDTSTGFFSDRCIGPISRW